VELSDPLINGILGMWSYQIPLNLRRVAPEKANAADLV
jgi:hypothetical protein